MARDELLDTEVGGWRIFYKVGQGATGSVYEARRGKRRVALKAIRPEVVQPESVERFRREARLLMEIDHPHVVRCFGAGETEDFVYMVLEFCDGGSLDLQLDRRKKFPIDESVGVAISILNGLEVIHEKGILHRDVKPANVLIDSEGMIKLADFNLARGMAVAQDVTTTGTILGTPYYMAPEQVEAKNLGPPLDLYATGAMLYHMISGEPPYTGSSPLSILQKHMNADLPELREAVPDAPEQIAEAIKTLMAKDQAERPQTAQEALALFEGLAHVPLNVQKARDSERNRPRPRPASSSGASTMARPVPAGGESSQLERTHAMDPRQGEAIRRAVKQGGSRPAQRPPQSRRPQQGQRPPPPGARSAPPGSRPTPRPTPRRATPKPGARDTGGRPRQGQRPPPPTHRDTGSRPAARPGPRRGPSDSGKRSGPRRKAGDTGSRPAPRPPGPRETGSRKVRAGSDRAPIPAPRPTRAPVPQAAKEADPPPPAPAPRALPVEPVEPGVRRPLPRVRKSKLLDLVVLLLAVVAGLYLYDATQRQRGADPLIPLAAQLTRAGLKDPEPVVAPLRAARTAISGVPLMAWLPLVGFLLFDRVLARTMRVGLLGRLHLKLRASSLLRSGDASAAAEVYEQLGDRDRAARVCLEAGLPERAAEYFTADGRTLQALEVADPFRALMAQGKRAEAGALLLDQGKLYAAADVLEEAGEVPRAIEALELGYKTDRIAEYGEHLGGGLPPAQAKRRLALRIAELHEQRQEPRWAGIYFERAGELRRAGELFGEIGDKRGQSRCLLGLFPPSGKLTQKQQETAERAAALLAELSDGQGVELYARLGMFGEAAELCRELKDEPQAAQFFARAGRPADGAACAERAGNRQLAAQLYDDAGQHSRAAQLYEQLGWFQEAADAARRSEDPALLAQMLEKLGDLLGAARALNGMGELRAARERLDKIAEDHPSWPEARVMIGELEHEAGRHVEAVAAYADGLPEAITTLAQVAPTLRYVTSLQKLNRHPEALAVLERFGGSKLAPKDYAKRRKELRELAGESSVSTPTRPLPPPRRDTAEAPALRMSDSSASPALRSELPTRGFAELEDLEPLQPPEPEQAPAPLPDPPITDPVPTRAMPRLAPMEQTFAAPEELLDRTVGSFRLLEHVNTGTFTFAYQALIEGQMGAEALVKVLRPEHALDLAAGDFVAAGRALVGRNYEHLLPVIDAGIDGDVAYIAYDRVRDPDLDEVMATEGMIGIQRAARLGAGLLNAVAHAHRLDLLHLDLKPSKVLVAAGSLARVHDFGVAQALAADSPHAYVDPRYASPEQARGEVAGPAADQYAAALLIYKMITGRLPFSSKTPAGFWEQHAHEPPVPIREYAEVPPGLADALMRALEKDPRARFAGAGELERVVAGFVRGGRESDRHVIPQASPGSHHP